MEQEDEPCYSIEVTRPCDIYVLYPDKQPVLPQWLKDYTRERKNVTRMDTRFDTLKGHFFLYRKSFPAGEILFYGNSSQIMLAEDWYRESNGANYCMYSVCGGTLKNLNYIRKSMFKKLGRFWRLPLQFI